MTADDAEHVRQRLAMAGIFAPSGPPRRRPDAEEVAAARAAAGRETHLSDLVSSGRS
ncbi:hypothetical protein [Geodermatophilus sp. TF02-6]|uniref:hypothetical protein n=1 Tax=Geodermatophilus sp. TF02-6 TaxID=2250575 RepID=UPI0013142670|nr:hypothetical protein [Geodermatophilus sp. TF02-6]